MAARKLMLKAIHDVREGREPPHILREPSAAHAPKILVLSELIPADANPREYRERLGAACVVFLIKRTDARD